MNCLDCATAAKQPHHGFTADCRSCCARAAARSPHYARVRDAGKLDRDYRAMLEQFKLSHDQLKAAAAIDALDCIAAASPCNPRVRPEAMP